jgi:hypothetical protein
MPEFTWGKWVKTRNLRPGLPVRENVIGARYIRKGILERNLYTKVLGSKVRDIDVRK